MKQVNTSKSFLLTVCISMMVSSGCGGGGGAEARLVAGVWNGQVVEATNTCGALRTTTTGNYTHTVNQNEAAVTLQDEQGISFLGNTVGDNGFSVDAAFVEEFSNGDGCSVSQRIEYNGIESDSDNTADVLVRSNFTCDGGFSCSIQSLGSASRTGIISPDPMPSSTPIADASCRNLRERSFTGDSGCGVSNVEVSISSQGTDTIVLLDPLGTNGATSFTVSEANPETASANRTDLQFMGGEGYSCSIECPSDITFTLSCFQEGGTTCSERF